MTPNIDKYLAKLEATTGTLSTDQKIRALTVLAEESLEQIKRNVAVIVEQKAKIDRLQMELDGMCNAEELRQAREERDRLREAIQNAVDWSNGREYEWGDRAENSFAFLHKALEESK